MLDKIEEEERLFGEKTGEFMNSALGKAKEKILDIAGEFSKNKIGINLVELVKDIKEDSEKAIDEKHNICETVKIDKIQGEKEEIIGEFKYADYMVAQCWIKEIELKKINFSYNTCLKKIDLKRYIYRTRNN